MPLHRSFIRDRRPHSSHTTNLGRLYQSIPSLQPHHTCSCIDTFVITGLDRKPHTEPTDHEAYKKEQRNK